MNCVPYAKVASKNYLCHHTMLIVKTSYYLLLIYFMKSKAHLSFVLIVLHV